MKNLLFQKIKNKILYPMTRTEIINYLIKKNNYTTYLEIGVNSPMQPGHNWNEIKAKIKHGVDPAIDTTFKVTSDEFFEKYAKMKYDIIFIDGLHIFEQVYRDIINSLKHLNDNGVIIIHDSNPEKEITQRRIRTTNIWHGDVWKAILKLRMENSNITIYTVNTDYGCSIIQKGYQKLLKIKNKDSDIYNFDFFEKNKLQILNLISVKEFKEKLGIKNRSIYEEISRIFFKLNKISLIINSLISLLKNIKRKIGRILPEEIKAPIRRIIRIIIPASNPSIPVEELRIFDLLKDEFSVVFDVGAREDLSFYKIKNNCSYHLFEPNPKAILSLKNQISQLKKHDIHINEFGLSDENKDNCIYYEDSQSFTINPLHKDIDTGKRFSLRTLDNYVEQNNISHIDFLKIDAEGLDYKIILGGLKTIKNKVSYIQFEYWDGVKKFVDLLGDAFDFYLMIEPGLLKAIMEEAVKSMSESQKRINYRKSIIKLDDNITDLIDKIIIPGGHGGNILGVSKNLKNNKIEKITFEI